MPAFSRPVPLVQSATMSSTAGPASLSLSGTLDADTLTGTEQDDTIDGGAGNDTINGLGGNDTLNGGDGHDVLDGGDDDDVLDGGSGNDRLVGHLGNDTLRGGEGDDELDASVFGASLLEGGTGKDRLRSYGGGDDRLFGGDGDDSLLLMEHSTGDRGATITLSGGAGDDTISMVLVNRAASVLASGGDGADLFNLGSNIAAGKIRILDFGASDRLDLQEWLPYGITGNPFGAGGYWKAVQEGADVAIYIDRDGAAGPNTALRLLTLANVSLASLTAANFVGGFDPAGASPGGGGPIGLTLTGTADDDILSGRDLDDTIDGRGGNDSLRGGAGDDKLFGGDGNDRLDGDAGNDRLEGGAGNDTLSDSNGDDYLSGGAGDDVLTSIDPLPGRAAGTTLDGGDGNDRLHAGGAVKTVLGGAGDDELTIEADGGPGNLGPMTIDLGGGNDRLTFRTGAGDVRALRVSGGDGSDTYTFAGGHGRPVLTITDFQPGARGDVLDVYTFAPVSRDTNPFGPAGGARLVQEGRHVLLQIDGDENAATQTWVTRVVFENILVADLVGANLGVDVLPGTPAPGQTLNGSTRADTLRGGEGDDVLMGLGGADLLYGNGGNDRMLGGAGNDRLEGGAGNDLLLGEAGNDELFGGAGDDTLQDNQGSNVLRGGGGNDVLAGSADGPSQVFGEAGDDQLRIEGGSGVFDGGDGHDSFHLSFPSASGATLLLTGGAGRDSYTPGTTSRGATVTITDFATGAGGDFIDLHALAGALTSNPFAPGGIAQLVQRGADTVLQARVNGAASFQDVFVLRGVARDALTSDNFFNNYDPNGNGGTISGTAGNDTLRGGDGDDTLLGGDGDDQLYGNGGIDFLLGDAGKDLLDGGDGDDTLDGKAGDDELVGGAGNDILQDSLGSNILRGGSGNDQLYGSADGPAQVFGEAGDDLLVIKGGSGVFDGGDGHDSFDMSFDSASNAALLLTGGAGRDSYSFSSTALGATVTVTDFVAGMDGDLINVERLLDSTASNPFAPGGTLQLVQRGADTVLQARENGAASFDDVVVLRGVAKGTLTQFNFINNFDPSGASAGMRFTGTAEADRAFGTWFDDVFRGGAGDDLLDGGNGIDTVLFGSARADYALPARLSRDMVVSDLRTGTSDGSDHLVGIERLVFTDGAIALDTGAADKAGQAYRIYRAAFDREPDLGGLGFWIARLDQGVTLQEMAAAFVRSDEFVGKYGAAPGNAEIVTNLYRNILDREPDKGGHDFYVSALDRKAATLGQVLADISESIENREGVAELIANGVAYLPFTG